MPLKHSLFGILERDAEFFQPLLQVVGEQRCQRLAPPHFAPADRRRRKVAAWAPPVQGESSESGLAEQMQVGEWMLVAGAQSIRLKGAEF